MATMPTKKPKPPISRHPSGQVRNFKATTAKNDPKLAEAKRFQANADSQPKFGMAGPQGGAKYKEAQKTIAGSRIRNRQALHQGYESPAAMDKANNPSKKLLSGRAGAKTLEETNAARAVVGKTAMTENKFANRQKLSGLTGKEVAAVRGTAKGGTLESTNAARTAIGKTAMTTDRFATQQATRKPVKKPVVKPVGRPTAGSGFLRPKPVVKPVGRPTAGSGFTR